MSDEYLIRDAIVGKPTDAEKSAAVAALGDLIRERDEARAAWKAANDRLAELTRVDNLASGEASPHD